MMTKQELLTKLAMECATWGEAAAIVEAEDKAIRLSGKFALRVISEQDWLDERERLLNKPSWADAPEGATHKAMDASGSHFFYKLEPKQNPANSEWIPEKVHRGGGIFRATKAIAIPAGYDWRDSLEERPA